MSSWLLLLSTLLVCNPRNTEGVDLGDVSSNFAGMDYDTVPPDTVLAVGYTQIIQAINTNKIAVFNKDTGAKLMEVDSNEFFNPKNGNFAEGTLPEAEEYCRTYGNGDPTVHHDQLPPEKDRSAGPVDRWIFQMFALNPPMEVPNYVCWAISKTSDATGNWTFYGFLQKDVDGTNAFSDYSKTGVWIDAYYISSNQYVGEANDKNQICGYNRTAMLAGESVTAVHEKCRHLANPLGLDDLYSTLLPADVDGPDFPPESSSGAPPPPCYFVGGDLKLNSNYPAYFTWSYTTDVLNYVTPPSPNSTVDALEFSPQKPEPYFRIPDPNGDPSGNRGVEQANCPASFEPGCNLDDLSDRVMFRLTYRYFGPSRPASLTFTHTIRQVSGGGGGTEEEQDTATSPIGVRWYELRTKGDDPYDPSNNKGLGHLTVHQQGFIGQNDSVSRWMGSSAMDKNGNIAVGYSVAGPNTPIGMRYTGRFASAPLSEMNADQEKVIITSAEGTFSGAYGPGPTFRWGDYSDMAIDPADDCTFWYTSQYVTEASSNLGRAGMKGSTRMASFRFSDCQTAAPTPAPTPDPVMPPVASAPTHASKPTPMLRGGGPVRQSNKVSIDRSTIGGSGTISGINNIVRRLFSTLARRLLPAEEE